MLHKTSLLMTGMVMMMAAAWLTLHFFGDDMKEAAVQAVAEHEAAKAQAAEDAPTP